MEPIVAKTREELEDLGWEIRKEEPKFRSLLDVEVGENLRGKKLRITNTHLPFLNTSSPKLTANVDGTPRSVLLGTALRYIQVSAETFGIGGTICQVAVWFVPDGQELTVVNVDAIVTTNTLTRGDASSWGFENVLIVEE